MDNQWYERVDRRPGGIGRKPGEAVRTPGDQQRAVDEERAFAPPRGPYEADRGYGEAADPTEPRRAQPIERQRYWDGYSFGSPGYGPETWYENPDRGGMVPTAPGYGREAGPYARPGVGVRDERGFWDRMSDEAASWFGDRYARERREADHRGLGPKGYQRSDERINEDVHERLTEDRHLDASGMTVSVSAGEVVLDGFVRTRHDKHRAEHIVEHVSGVGHIQNNLRIGEPPAGAEDSVLDRQASGRT